MNLGLEGRFEIVKHKALMRDGEIVINADGEQVIDKENMEVIKFNNLITDTGLDLFKTEYRPFEYFYLSSDNSEPSAGDSNIPSIMGIGNSVSSAGSNSLSGNEAWFDVKQVVRFAAGVATGNISKIGTGASSNGLSKVFSVALVKDASGLSTTISKLPDEILDITYRLRVYISTTDVVGGVINFGANYYNVIIRPTLVNLWSGAPEPRGFTEIKSLWGTGDTIQTAGNLPSEPPNRAMIFSENPYVLASHESKYIFRAALDKCVFTDGLKCIGVVTGIGYAQIGILNQVDAKGVIKTLEQTLAMPPFTISWGRYVAT